MLSTSKDRFVYPRILFAVVGVSSGGCKWRKDASSDGVNHQLLVPSVEHHPQPQYPQMPGVPTRNTSRRPNPFLCVVVASLTLQPLAVTLDQLRFADHTLHRPTRLSSPLTLPTAHSPPVASVSASPTARYAPLRTRPQGLCPVHHPIRIYLITASLAHSGSRPTMIMSNLSPPPTFPATFWDLVPFLCAGGLALIFTALLVLLVEDDSSDRKVLGEQRSQLASYQRRFVGLSEKEREWSTRPHSSYYSYSPFQKKAMGSPASMTGTAKTSYQRPVFPKRLFGAYPSRNPLPHLGYVLHGCPFR